MPEYWWKATDMTKIRDRFGLTFADIGFYHELKSRGMNEFRNDLREDRRKLMSPGDTTGEITCSGEIRESYGGDTFILLPMSVARSVANSGGYRRVTTALDRLKPAGLVDYTDDVVSVYFADQRQLDLVIEDLERERKKKRVARSGSSNSGRSNKSRPQGSPQGTGTSCPPVPPSRDRSKTLPTGEVNTSYSHGATAALTGEPAARSAPEKTKQGASKQGASKQGASNNPQEGAPTNEPGASTNGWVEVDLFSGPEFDALFERLDKVIPG